MALTKTQKEKIIEDLKEKIEKQKITIFVNFTGLKVTDLFELRKKLKLANCQLKVAKKTLLNLVLKDYNAALFREVAKLKGQMAVIFGFKETISPAKITYQFSLENPNLKILGGYFEERFRESGEIITLAQLPTRDELLARLVRDVSALISNFVNILEGNLKGLIFILSAIKK
ncbi:50S ribosomal protein L10 [Patescibacteria group bacterium]|nr:50S ribosomal protein L10 [Patescibacteria group bacterium]